MPRLARAISESGYYHVVLRGAGKMIIFEDNEDYRVFIAKMMRKALDEEISIIAFCLMSNHVHIVLHDWNAHLSSYISKLATSYALRFNDLYDHVGHVFQGRFYSIPIVSDEQLLEAVRYVHQNPYKASISSIDDYPWSSYNLYVTSSEEIDTHTVLALMGSVDSFVAFSHQSGSSYSIPVFGKHRLSDAEAATLLRSTLTESEYQDLHGDSRTKRDAALRKLRDLGIGISQAVRLAGIGRSIVSKAYHES